MSLKLNNIPFDFHLSWSALSLLEKGEKYWIDKYINGKQTYETEYLKLGKKFAECMEDGFSDDEEVEFICSLTPRLERTEEEVRAEYQGVELLGFKDSSDDRQTYEYKTAVRKTSKGEDSWTHKKAKEHGQLAFYALIDTINGKEIPKFTLFWIPTQMVGKKLTFTGEVIPFEVEITPNQVKDMKMRVDKALITINRIYGETL
jgi:hypothetical protein